MKEKDLVRAMNNIDDKYIKEAEGVKSQAKKKDSSRATWKTWAAAIVGIFVLVIGVGVLFGGNIGSLGLGSYGSKSASTEAVYYDNGMVTTKEMAMESSSFDGIGTYAVSDAVYEYAKTEESVQNSVDLSDKSTKGLKIIKNAYVSIQTTEFEETVNNLEACVASYEGYIQSSSIDNGSMYSDGTYKYGYYTVRIPAEKYDEFISGLGEGYYVVNISESIEDIGEQYFDTENRLKTLKTKLERLQDLLSKAENLSDIITLESEISDTEYQIDSYTSTLNRYDSLVGYSTINIDIQKVTRVTDTIEQDESFWAKLLRSLENGALNFVDRLGDLAYWATYNIIGIVIVIVVIVIFRKNHILRKIFGREKKAKNEEDAE